MTVHKNKEVGLMTKTVCKHDVKRCKIYLDIDCADKGLINNF